MTIKELQQAVYKLSSQEQLMLLDTLVDAMKGTLKTEIDRHALVRELRGCLRQSGQSIPSDRDIEAMREDRLVEKYLG